MRFAVKGVMRYSTAKKRDTARGAYGRAVKTPPADRRVDLAMTEDAEVWAVLDAFALLTDRETALTRLTGDLDIVDGSRIQAHDCFHDEGRPCVVTAEWVRSGGLMTKVL